jgi:hypothetical protein
MRKVILLMIVVFFCSLLSAQKKGFQPGSYITHHGDTMRGYIYLPENSPSLRFIKAPAAQDTTDIPVDDLKALVVNNSSYRLWYGTRCVTWLDPIELDVMYPDSFRTELIMVKPIYEGSKFSLYEYKDETDRYFIGYAGVVEELQMTYRKLSGREYRNKSLMFNQPKYSVYAIFRWQIMDILGGTVSDYERSVINQTEYNSYNLKKLIKEMETW